MSTRRTSPKDNQPEKSDEKPFLDLAAINEGMLAEMAKKFIAEAKREGKFIPPPKRDPKEDEEDEKMLSRLFGPPIDKPK